MFIPFNQEEELVIASDNSGAIGMKVDDEVKVPYETVAYFSFRVAAMECISAGGEPFAVTLQNFCGELAWEHLRAGIEEGLEELGLAEVEITGSTESNFSLKQSAIGVTILGKKKISKLDKQLNYSPQLEIAVIGSPLVGNEVIEKGAEVVPLSTFYEINSLENVSTLPVGSKGILFELNQLFSNLKFSETDINSNIDLMKSSGPSTCFIVVYPIEKQDEIEGIAGTLLHKVVGRRSSHA
ncbi:ATP-binding protein [Mesobacillus persicus]|uniref:ATP-binding protein n=1 Tax=Mesobacillus persicus TaxID=930146 RepID=UPI00313A1CE7